MNAQMTRGTETGVATIAILQAKNTQRSHRITRDIIVRQRHEMTFLIHDLDDYVCHLIGV